MTENDCQRIFALLSEYLDQELPPATCEELEQHLRNCPPCVQFVQNLRRSVDLCRQLGQSRDLPPPAPEVVAGLRAAYEKMLAKRRAS
jgi:anti-sigma factor RsiW